jgi:hypothetical protein
MVSEQLRAEGLLTPSPVGFGFEGLDFVTNALVGPAAGPFGLGRHWLVDIWEAAEAEAELCGGEAFAAVAIALLSGVGQLVAMLAGQMAVAKEQPASTIAAFTDEDRTRLAETCANPMQRNALSNPN